MVIKSYFVYILLIFALLVSCKNLTKEVPNTDIIAINNLYKTDLKEFYNQTLLLGNQLNTKNISTKDVKESYLQLRNSFKKVETILAYTKPIATSTYINGAPLTKVERFNPKVVIKEPEGIQVIDELISEEIIDFNSISELVNKLILTIKKEIDFFENLKINEYHFYESIRQQIIRIAAMGITGFDTPGSLNGLNDAKTSLLNIQKYIVNHTKNKDINTRLNNSIKYLNNNNQFEIFNRMVFIRNYLNPLLAQFTRIKNTFNEKDFSKFQPPKSLSKNANNLFDENVLDPSFFSRVKYDQAKSGLGKLLFFDPILSDDNSLSCASCHDPKKAFTDGKVKSIQGHGDNNITRNSPTLINSVFASAYFLDHRINNLQKQIEDVIENNLEFNSSYANIVKRLKKEPAYQKKFKEIYGENSEITIYGISHALVHYLNSLTSFDSEFDKYMRNEIPEISTEVENGFNLFMGKAACGTCHFAPTFSGLLPPNYIESETEVLGVPKTLNKNDGTVDPDLGRYKSGKIKDAVFFQKYAFKTVTIRNIALTAPYMHNGVFQTLEEVMDFYNHGGGPAYGINLEHQTLAPDSLQLTEKEQSEIISFMKSLTDKKFENH